MRKVGTLFFKCTILLFLYPALCVAEQYDTGWMRLEAEDLQELTFTGNDVTVNNFNLNIDNNLLYGNANVLEFTASAINRSEDSKSVSIQLISLNKENSYGFALSAQPRFFRVQAGKSDEIKATFLIGDIKLDDMVQYAVRVIIN